MEAIYKALSKAQQAFPAIPRDGKNPHFKSTYTTLDTLLRTTRESLCTQGLAVSHIFEEVDGKRVLVTRLVHESGEVMESRLRLPDTENMQHLGSAITYARRYSLAALLGVSSDDDDDGQAASPSGNPYKDRAKQRNPPAAAPPEVPLLDRAKKRMADFQRIQELEDFFLQCKDSDKIQSDQKLWRELAVEIGCEIERRVNTKKWTLDECDSLIKNLKGEIDMLDTIDQSKEAFGDE